MNREPTVPEEEADFLHPDYKSEIAAIIKSNLTPRLLREKVLSYHEYDIAAAMELLKKEERVRFCYVLDAESLARVLEYSDDMATYMGELNMRKRAEVLAELEASDAAEYLKELGEDERKTLIGLIDDAAKREINLLASFGEDEIGSRMTTNYISVVSSSSVRQTMSALIDQAAENDNISTIYVVDSDGVFVGAIDLKDLIIARENTPLEDITVTSYPYVYADEKIEDCIERLKEYYEDSIPVLDGENKLKGVLTAPDVTELVDDEMSEDYAKLAGLTAEEDLEEPLNKSIRKRLPWLVVLLGLGLLVSGVVGLFEQVMASLTLIVCFQSLILDMSGNVGTQSLAVTIRVLMDENLSGREKWRLVLKEARVGLCNGAILGGLSFLAVGLYLFAIKSQPASVAFSVSLCTGAALLLAMFLSGISGTVIPLAFKKMKIDPAVASGPLITTVNDLVAVVTYYGFAWLFLIDIMHITAM